jgi:hypothetical protein
MTAAKATPAIAPVPVFYWSDKPNFGDLIGPYLVERLTGRPVRNCRRDRRVGGLMTVGSILSMLDRPGTAIWGSGLIAPLADREVDRLSRCPPAAIRAVRGPLTRDEVQRRLGWEVPAVYGDPGLLLPRFIAAPPRTDAIVLVPHFSHRHHVAGLEDSPTLSVVDVAQPLEAVVARIAAAGVCISSSLHGLAVAQAYGVPWVFMRMRDAPLSGSDFEFDDFFATLDLPAAGPATFVADPASGPITRDRLLTAAETARLPTTACDLDALLAAFPADHAG